MAREDVRYVDCHECGSYQICDYCYEECLDKNKQYEHLTQFSSSSEDEDPDSSDERTRSKCIYCMSKANLNDTCVKSLKTFGFVAPNRNNGSQKIPISSLTKDKIKKLSNLRVI